MSYNLISIKNNCYGKTYVFSNGILSLKNQKNNIDKHKSISYKT